MSFNPPHLQRTLRLLFMSMILLPRSHHRAVTAFTYHSSNYHAYCRATAGLDRIYFGRLTATPIDIKSTAATKGRRMITDLPGITPELWSKYESSIRQVSTSDRGLRKKVPSNVEPVTNYLCYDQCLLDVVEIDKLSPEQAKERLREQKDKFLQKTGLSLAEYEYCNRCLTYLGDYCARQQAPQPLLAAWYKIKECGMIPRENGLSTYMYAMSLDKTLADSSAEVASLHDLLYDPNEKTVTLRIKALIAKGDAFGAEQILSSLPDKGQSEDWRRLRTYMPIVTYYCAKNDFSSVLRVFRQMRNSAGAHMDAETYALVLGTLARNGCISSDSQPIEGAFAAGFSVTHGPLLFDEMAAEMASDIMELNEASALVLHQALSEGFGLKTVGSDLEPVSVPADRHEIVADRVVIDETAALCPRTGVKLSLFVLDDAQRKHVHDTLLKMADVQHKEIIQKSPNTRQSDDPDYAIRCLLQFSQWMEEREGLPFTALVDGANIAYFGHADVHYSQIDLVVNELIKMGEQPLVIMPEKYSMPRFHISTGFLQKLTQRELEILERLKSSGMLYVVPSRCLDDYYWMLGSVSNQTKSRNGADLSISPGPECGRFPGLRPILVSNDQMRDHKLALLEPRLFRRWSSSHIVNYNISLYEKDEWEERQVRFFPADFFSREIQSNTLNADGRAWHFPVAEWGDYDRLCIRL